MNVTTQRMKRALIVRVDGELDMHTAPQFTERVEQGFQAAPQLTSLILVLSEVTFVDSSGLGAILAQYRRVVGKRGRVVLVGPKPPVRKVLQMSGLHKLMEIVASEAQAVLQA